MKPCRYLDPRPAVQAERAPYADSVNIPLDEIASRTHELPPKDRVILVAGDDPSPTIELLQGLGREAVGVVAPAAPQLALRGRLWEPNAFLSECAPALEPGAMLDLACGSGRDCVYMAHVGWSTLGVDLLPDALERAGELARRYLSAEEVQRTEWAVEDVESPRFSPPAVYDLITMFFFLNRDLLRRSHEWLKPGGWLMVETFTQEHRRLFGKPRGPELVLLPGELRELVAGLEIVRLEEGLHQSRHSARLLARKPL
jgi:tellurite methyltransferase